jgi:adenylate cyclase
MTAETHALRREALAVFARGLAACYAGNLAEAERIFRQTAGVDPAAQAYADRCRELAAAPARPATATTDAWTGAWIMTSK